MRKLQIFFVTLCAVTLASAGFVSTYQNCAVLNEEKQYRIHWTLSGSQIRIGLEAPISNGWAGCGISEDGTMDSGGNGKFSDGWVMGINPGDDKGCGNGCIGDLILTRHSRPNWDNSQSLNNIKVSNNGSYVFGEFTRALNTGDSEDKAIVPGTIQHVIWSMHQNSLIKYGQIPTQHQIQGSVSVDFGANSTCNPTAASGNSYSAVGGAWIASWELSDDKKTINFTVTAKTTGWVGLGISNTASMVGADVYVGWVADSGSAVSLYDCYASAHELPATDVAQGGTNGLISFSGKQEGGVTTLSFSRLVESADTKDTSIADKKQFLLFAFGTADGTPGDNPTFAKHSANGLVPINFMSSNGTDNGGGGGGGPVTPGGIDPSKYSFDNPVMKLSWEVDANQEYIHFKMEGQTTGWLAIGFNSEPKMIGSDVHVAWVDDSSNAAVLLDCQATEKAAPSQDTDRGGSNDLLLTSGTQSNGITTVIFRRKLNTGDSKDWVLAEGSTTVVFAKGDADGSFGFFSKHSLTSTASINFFTGSSSALTQTWSPGSVLVVITILLLVLYSLLRFLYLVISFRGKKINRNQLSPVIPVGSSTSNGGEGGTEMQFQDSPSYLKGSQRVESETGKVLPLKSFRPRTHGNRVSNGFYGVLYWRIPRTDVALIHLIVFIIYLGINVGCLFVESDRPKSFGTIIAANAFLATIPATRNSIIVVMTGVPFDKTIMFHRWIGRNVVAFATIHVIYTWVTWAQAGTLKEQFTERVNIYGFVAWLILLLMSSSAYSWIRRNRFEVFYYTHFIFVAFFTLGCLHNVKFIPFAISACVIYGLDRIFRLCRGLIPMKTEQLRIKDSKESIVQVKFKKGSLGRKMGLYKPGQYVFVNFPGLSFLEWHPFSLVSGPDEINGEVNIKSLGNFTTELVKRAKKKSKMWIRVDGPYGNLNLDVQRFPIHLLVAGGIGFTPVLSILKHIYRTGNLRKEDQEPLRHCMEHIHVVWTIQSLDQASWFQEELDEIRRASMNPQLPSLHLDIYVTRASGEVGSGFIKGRPKFHDMFNSLATNYMGKAKSVFVCGPAVMVQDIWDHSMKHSRQGHNFHFHHETFEF